MPIFECSSEVKQTSVRVNPTPLTMTVLELMLREPVERSLWTISTSPLSAASWSSVLSSGALQKTFVIVDQLCERGICTQFVFVWVEHPSEDRRQCECQTVAPFPSTDTLCPHEHRTHQELVLCAETLCRSLSPIAMLYTVDISLSLPLSWQQPTLTEAAFYSRMCGEAVPVDQMSQDSNTPKVVSSQVDTLVDYKS